MTDPDEAWDRTRRLELTGTRGAHRPPVPAARPRSAVPPTAEPQHDVPAHDEGEYDQYDEYDQDEYDQTQDDDGYDDRLDGLPPDPLWRRLVRTAGELLVTAGVVLLLFVVYEVYVTDLVNDHVQSQLSDQVHEQWDAAPTPTALTPMTTAPAEGDPLAVLHIPRLGEDYSRVVLEGTAEDQLSKGPGHYDGTALPGQPGNLALAGHRVGKGSPFLDLDQLRPGDAIVVEVADGWYTYRVLGDPATGDFTTDPSGIPGQEIVTPSQVEVIAPTPDGAADAAPTGSYLTLTTCHPKYSARQRLIIHAVLEGPGVSKADAPDGPPALTEG